MRALLTLMIWVLAICQSIATPYHTPRLEKMARTLGLQLKDPLPANTTMDSIATKRGLYVYLRTNGMGDVAHIGYHLFSDALREGYENSPVFNFLERYLLELDLLSNETERAQRMDADEVVVVQGSLQTLRQLTPQSELNISIDVKKRKMYRVTCQLKGKTVKVSFPCIYELLIGANMIELEDIFRRDVQRMINIPSDAMIFDWSKAKRSESHAMMIVDGGMYLSKMIRGDIYLKKTSQGLLPLCDTTNVQRSVSNILLTGYFPHDIPLKMDIDHYGNRKDTIDITLQQFITYCKAEGCQLYFGIKTRTEKEITGTFFAYNEKNSYDHMLTVVFPLSILRGSSEPVRGKVYTYIPLHFVADKYFDYYEEPLTD